ncbi:spermatogenesis-associated protein 31A6-like [Tupaia chinensis]|uniref:spermatogenesis-associated protein 31A6-like n=1 Tax=Tupaia chinensis TaxID=246437 RepID=UPI0003C90A8B|nr:spermatogenesis-associated protein 31A6-like [Tupaia chinensis]
MRSSRSDSKNDLSGSVNKNHLGNMLTLHLGLKSGQINEGLIPLSVRQSWLALNSPFSRSDTQVVTGNLALSKSWEEACTSSSQEFYFLKPCTQQMLEEHITKFRAKHKWGLPLKVLKPINVFKLKKAESLPLTLCALPSSTTCESGIDKLLVKPPQVGPREVTKESVPTLSSCLLVSSPANQEIQRALRVPSWSHDHGSSEAPPPRQERRQPSQSLSCNLVGRTRQSGTVLVAGRDSLQIRPSSTMTRNEQGKKYGDWATQDPYHSVALLEMNLGSQSLKAEETNETVPTCSILLETSVLANLQATNEKSGLETSGTSESLLLPSMSVTQKAGKPCLKTKVSVVEPSVEIKSESRTQVCDMGSLLPDCSAGMSLVEDCLATQTSQCHLQCVPMGNMPTSQVVSDHTVARKSKLRQLETGSSNHRGSWKSQSNIFTSTYKNEDCRRRNPRKHEERVEKLLTSQLTPVRRIDSLESKRVQILLQKERVPSESPFKKKLRCFLHWIFCKIKGKRQEGPLQKGKLSPATAQSQGPFKTRSCVGKNTEEAQHLMTTLEQVLEKKMVLHHRIRASKLKQCKEELKGPALKFSCKRKLPLNTEQKKRSSYAACNQQATTKRQVCSLRERQVRNQQSLKNTRFWNEPRGPSHSQLLLLRKAATLAHPCQHRPRMLNVSGHRHHCPRHCLVRRGVLSWQPKHFSLAFPRKICL